MSGRRRVDHDVRVLSLAVQLTQLKQRHHFIESRQRKTQQLVDVFFIEQRAALGNLGEHLAVRFAKPFQRKTRVHLVSKQTRTAKLFYFNESVADLYFQTVGE